MLQAVIKSYDKESRKGNFLTSHGLSEIITNVSISIQKILLDMLVTRETYINLGA